MRTLLLLAFALILNACSDDRPPPTAPGAAATPQPTVLDDQLKAMDKAKAVSAENLETKRKADEQIDGGG